MSKKAIQKNNKGFTVLEVVIYFSLLAVISVLVITNIISLFKSYNVVRANQEIEYNAIAILDKLTRDVHDSKNIVIADSSFSIAQGAIALNIASSTNELLSDTIRFYLEDLKVKYMKNGTYFGDLSTSNVAVQNFKIYYISSTTTEAIKVEMTLEAKAHLNSNIISKNFYTTIQLRE